MVEEWGIKCEKMSACSRRHPGALASNCWGVLPVFRTVWAHHCQVICSWLSFFGSWLWQTLLVLICGSIFPYLLKLSEIKVKFKLGYCKNEHFWQLLSIPWKRKSSHLLIARDRQWTISVLGKSEVYRISRFKSSSSWKRIIKSAQTRCVLSISHHLDWWKLQSKPTDSGNQTGIWHRDTSREMLKYGLAWHFVKHPFK